MGRASHHQDSDGPTQICDQHMRLWDSGIQSSIHKILFMFFSPCLQYSLCNEPLIELSNPGASGSVFYVTKDDEFIIKTVMHKEAEFLQKLLPGYYMVSMACGVGGCLFRDNRGRNIAHSYK